MTTIFRGKSPEKHGVFYCCSKQIPFSGLVIEGLIKVVMTSIGKSKILLKRFD